MLTIDEIAFTSLVMLSTPGGSVENDHHKTFRHSDHEKRVDIVGMLGRACLFVSADSVMTSLLEMPPLQLLLAAIGGFS